ncbi:hypothetical protein [Burkholderia pyrrocinia]|uniref:Uncharacterized protein n=1 Tax=Burkholderia pyrrocinia TaxID=60550 RepID=A0ABZ3BN54_BURPY
MPEQVDDADAENRLAQIKALYARREPFALVLDGEEIPRQSPRLMFAYAQWSRDNVVQMRHCVGTIRVEADASRRLAHEEKARAWNASAHTPYPFHVVTARTDAEARATALLEQADCAARAAAVLRSP